MTCVVENTAGAEAKFNPEQFDLENLDNGISILIAGKGKMDMTVAIGGGKKVAQNFTFVGNPGEPAAKNLKLTYGKATMTFAAK